MPEPEAHAWHAALEVVPFGILLFDRARRLIQFNRPAADLLPGIVGQIRPGAALESLFCVEGTPPEVALREGASLAEVPVSLTAAPTPDGGVVVTVMQAPPRLTAGPLLAEADDSNLTSFWKWNVTGGEVLVNDRWLAMIGLSREGQGPLTFEWCNRLMHPADRATLHAALDDVLHHRGAEFDLLFRMRHAAGHWVWIRSRGRGLTWSDTGLALTVAGVNLDVTAQKTAELRLEEILESAQVGTWRHDERSGNNLIDAGWAAMLGYSVQELAVMTVADLAAIMHPDDAERLAGEQKRRRSDGAWTFDNEIRIRHKKGHWVWIQSRGRVTDWDDKGRPLVTAGVHIDISERKSLQAALAQERDFLATLMEASMSGILALDANGTVIFANREAETVLGRPMSELLGQPCCPPDWDLTDANLVPVDHDSGPSAVAMRTGQTQRGQRLGLRWPDGSRRTLAVNAAPLTVPGVDAAVVVSVTDITDAVESEAALRRAMERAEAGNRAKSEFLANISHEIRTPLNGVLGMAEVLGKTLTQPDQRKMISTMQDSGAHLLQILNDILDLSKIESGRMSLDVQPFRLSDLAERVEALHQVRAQAKGISVRVLCDAGASQLRSGDPQRVLQVLHNLMGNAIKFTQTGGVRLSITAPAGGPVVIEVADTGIGMSAEQAELVFQDFVQADGSITRRFGGTGLGLPIVRKLVTMMGGEIRLQTLPGLGTRVWVELPLAEQADSAAVPTILPKTLAGVRALVAEDNGTNRMILRSMLSLLGVEVAMVEDGDEAVAIWQSGRFDVLLLDISMPGRDGVSALHAIRARACAAGVACPPALAVTANAMTHHVDEYLKAGFVGCVSKPMRLDDLGAALSRAVTAPQDQARAGGDPVTPV